MNPGVPEREESLYTLLTPVMLSLLQNKIGDKSYLCHKYRQ